MSRLKLQLALVSLLFLVAAQPLYADDAGFFYPGGSYDQGLVTPEEFLGHSLAEKPSHYDEIRSYFLALAEQSPRMKIVEDGASYEGRPMFYAVIASEENMARLEDIKNGIGKLADPRKTGEDEAESLIDRLPAVAWIMYTIHGNELSGSESSMQCAWQLAAGNDAATRKLRDELVICLYPMENPDGRERFINQVYQWNGPVPHDDYQSMHLHGDWPPTRGNHYLFDLNRDWFILAHPESRARVRALLEWKPQLLVDAHEMGSYDTFLFSPPREPINPHVSSSVKKWLRIFADEQAQAFNAHGWSYYTGEWNESWYPGYTTSYGCNLGAVSILYEQALTGGTQVKRPDGNTLTYREAVHHQFVSSFANLMTAANNRKAMLGDFYAMKKETVETAAKAKVKAYVVDGTKNPSRAARLMNKLAMQGIEIGVAGEPFTLSKARDIWSDSPEKMSFPKGSYVIRLDQPLRPLVESILEFDPHLTTEVLQDERQSLEKGNGSRMYEVSTWSMFLAYDVDAFEAHVMPEVSVSPFRAGDLRSGSVSNPDPAFGYLIEYNDDSAVTALLRLLDKGCKVRSATKPFTLDGKDYDRGTLLLRGNENREITVGDLEAVARETGAVVTGVDTAQSENGPDLGGRTFKLLEKPKVAMIFGPSVNQYSFGSLWYHFEQDLGYRCTLLFENYVSWRDLRKYNVIVLPSGSYANIIGKGERFKDWIRNGGTLIAVGSASAYLADKDRAFCNVRLRNQSLEDLDDFARDLVREDKAGKTVVDSLTVWGLTAKDANKSADSKKAEKAAKLSKEELAELDRMQRLFRPYGAFVNAALDEEYWLSFGIGNRMSVLLGSSYAFLAKSPVKTVARLTDSPTIRLSGLLWPEARERWSRAAYVMRESMGRGQVILFADEPFFRSYFYGSARLFDNAFILGPGIGASQAVEW